MCLLDQAALTDSKRKTLLLKALYKGIGEGDGQTFKCFEPRHALRAKFNGKIVDVLICYQCIQIEIFDGGEGRFISNSLESKALFDQILVNSKVPLATD